MFVKRTKNKVADFISSLSPVVLMSFCTLFTSLGQLFLKLGANSLAISLRGTFLNWHLLLGILFYLFGAALFMITLRRAELSITYPLISLSFIWVSLLSIFFLGEMISIFDWGGMILIIAGISLIGRGA